MRRHLIVGAVLAAVVAAAIGATMALAGGDAIPTCGSVISTDDNIVPTTCTSYRVEWQLGPPEAFQFDAKQVVGQATISGLATTPGARDTFDIYAYNWGVALQSSLAGGGGGGAGRPRNQEFTIVKYVDELTPLLSQACETGVRFPSATVTVKSKTGTMTYAFADITCGLDKQGADGDHDASPLEQFSWTYRAIEWIFTPKGGGTPVTRCFNVVANTSACPLPPAG